ncbi:MAG: RNA methyltransferase [Alphaproteobacteria bacterium]|nr:RNA methyltransferase [Alphaproteobacteria bacterium]
MGENIGAAARAMANFALADLRLVRPRDGWPNPDAVPMAAGATDILDRARVFRSTEDAVADLNYVIATTARQRGMIKPVLSSRAAAEDLAARAGQGQKTGILFGGERSGLGNDDVALADAVVTIPTNPGFTSINIAQAVLLLGYEWFVAAGGDVAPPELDDRSRPATKRELLGFMEHLEGALDEAGFLYPADKRPSMVRNLRNMWHRADLREQDVRTLRGIIVALTSYKSRGNKTDGETES